MIGPMTINKIQPISFRATKYLCQIYKPLASYGHVPSRLSSTVPSVDLAPEIDFKELRNKIDSKEILLIDVRTVEENLDTGCVPGAVNIPLMHLGDTLMLQPDQFKESTGIQKPSSSDPIVVMCLLGIRAMTAQLAFIGAGYSNVRKYKGSFKDWKENDGPIEYKSS